MTFVRKTSHFEELESNRTKDFTILTAIKPEGVFTAFENHSPKVTIPRIDVAATTKNRLLVVSIAARGGRPGKKQVQMVVVYDGEPMDRQSVGEGKVDAQFGGTWIFTLMDPRSGGSVDILFEDFIPEDIAACAVVFSGVNPDAPIGLRDGALFTKREQSVSPYGVAVEPWQDSSLLFCAIVSGLGEENSLAAVSANVDVIKTIPVGEISLNVTLTEVDGPERQALGVILSPESTRNLFAMIEIVSEPQKMDLVITEVGFNGNWKVVPPGSTLENGISIPGKYGVLTIGADGNYNYEEKPEVTACLDPSIYLEEVFDYVLSDGTRSSIGVSVFESAVIGEASTSESFPDEEDEGVGPAVTFISHHRGGRVMVPSGTSSATGVSIEGDHGVLKIGADGTYSYEVHPYSSLAPYEPVTEVFSYIISDGRVSSEANLTVEVEGVEGDYLHGVGPEYEDAGNRPTIVAIAAQGQPPLEVAKESTLTNRPTVVKGSYGILSIGADGVYDYAVDHKLEEPGVDLEDVFTYTLSDGSSAIITITTEGVRSAEVPSLMPEEESSAMLVREQTSTWPGSRILTKKTNFLPEKNMISSGAVMSYSDFLIPQMTPSFGFENCLSKTFEMSSSMIGVVSSSFADPASQSRMLTFSSSVVGENTPKTKVGAPGVSLLPLGDITQFFKGPDDRRFFCGFKVVSCEPDESGEVVIEYLPYFAGASQSPNASIRVSIHDNFGIDRFGLKEVLADSSGRWTAEPDIDLNEEVVYSITIDEFPTVWETSAVPVRSMMAKFSGSFNPEEHIWASLTAGQIIGSIQVAQSVQEVIDELQI